MRNGFLILFTLSLAFTVHSFDFTHSESLTECGDVTISWTGGIGPYQLLLTPTFSNPRNISIPDSAFRDGKGAFTTQVNVGRQDRLVLTMSDSTGFATGGNSNLLSLGAPAPGRTCNTADPEVGFTYQLNNALQQCRPYTFAGFAGAVQPVRILGIIPGGETFILRPPTGPISFTWVANARSGTSIIWVMQDARGTFGGSSDVTAVAASDDASCINNNSPSSTAPRPTASSTSASTPPRTSASSSSTQSSSSTPSPSETVAPGSGGTSIAAVAGTVIGALVFLAVSITLGLFFLRRKRETGSLDPRRSSYKSARSPGDFVNDQAPHSPYHYPSPPTNGPPSSNTYPFLSPGNTSNPFLSPANSTISLQRQPSQTLSDPFSIPAHLAGPPQIDDPFTPQPYPANYTPSQAPTTSMTAAQRKAAMAASESHNSQQPSRFILHTDIDDLEPQPNADGVFELPPQYSERRGPSAATAPQSTGVPSTTPAPASQNRSDLRPQSSYAGADPYGGVA